jgi:hypothetical protein
MSLNTYIEQQRAEELEDKYAELQRQNQLMKKENELLKLGNYNLKRDNDILRGDAYNLRLENSKLVIELSNLVESSNAQIDELKCECEALKIELENERPKTNLLPKVAEKETYREFMLKCAIPKSITIEYMESSARKKYLDDIVLSIDQIIDDDDEYIVCNTWNIQTSSCRSALMNFILTNKGKMFFKLCLQGTARDNEYASYYVDFKVREMNLPLVDGILRKFLTSYGCNGYVHYETTNLTSTLPIISWGDSVCNR